MTHDDPCAHCEEMMQPYLDHILSDEEMREAEMHLEADITIERPRADVFDYLAHAEHRTPPHQNPWARADPKA